MDKIIKFSVDTIEEINEDIDDLNFATARLKAFADGDNRHHLIVSEDSLKKSAHTIYDKPLVWIYDEYNDDIGGHDKMEIPCGFVHRENNPITYTETEDGRLMLTVNAKIWKRYSRNLMDLFMRDGGIKPVSVEIKIDKCKELENGMIEIEDFSYFAITILGTNVVPAIPDAECEIIKFSEAKESYYQKYFESKAIKINNSKDGAINKSGTWTNPGRRLYGKLLKASNSKALVNEAYLVVEEGYEDSPSTSLKYPHHSIVNGELVINIQGLQAAFSRASQLNIVSGEVKEHLLRHYRELGLDTTNFTVKEDEVEMENNEENKVETVTTKTTEVVETKTVKTETQEISDIEVVETSENFEEKSENVEIEEKSETIEVEEPNETEEIEKIEDDKVSYESKISEFEDIIAKLESEKKELELELDELRKYKQQKENDEKNFKVSKLFEEVMDVLPKKEYNELLEESKSIENKDFEAFSNKVKALCFSIAIPNKNKEKNRMAINLDDEVVPEKKFW